MLIGKGKVDDQSIFYENNIAYTITGIPSIRTMDILIIFLCTLIDNFF